MDSDNKMLVTFALAGVIFFISLFVFIYELDKANNKAIMECIKLGNTPMQCECALIDDNNRKCE